MMTDRELRRYLHGRAQAEPDTDHLLGLRLGADEVERLCELLTPPVSKGAVIAVLPNGRTWSAGLPLSGASDFSDTQHVEFLLNSAASKAREQITDEQAQAEARGR